ncbi:hypothetical protein ACRRTK_000113 [Alexandromys fortis]
MTQRFKLGPNEGAASNNAQNNIICRSRINNLVKTHWPEMGRTHCLTSHNEAPCSVTQLSYGTPHYRVPRKWERPAAGKVEGQRVKARAEPGEKGNQVSHLYGQGQAGTGHQMGHQLPGSWLIRTEEKNQST